MLTSQSTSQMVVTMTTEEFKAIVNETVQSAITRAIEKYREAEEENSLKPEETYYTRADVIQMFHIEKTTLYRWTKDGKLPCINAGRRVMYSRTAVEQFIREHQNKIRLDNK